MNELFSRTTGNNEHLSKYSQLIHNKTLRQAAAQIESQSQHGSEQLCDRRWWTGALPRGQAVGRDANAHYDAGYNTHHSREFDEYRRDIAVTESVQHHWALHDFAGVR